MRATPSQHDPADAVEDEPVSGGVGAGRSVLVADGDAIDRATTASALYEAGYAVVEADGFDRARLLLSSLRPHLLITDVRLGAFNGLHLVWVRSLGQPAIPAIVTYDHPDAVLESEARTLGCPFLVKPLTAQPLLRVVGSLLGTHRRIHEERRHGLRKRVLDAPELAVGRCYPTVVDISDGGCRLQVEPGEDWSLTDSLQIQIPPSNVIVRAVPVWKASSAAGDIYGLAIRDRASQARAWRSFVDRVRRG